LFATLDTTTRAMWLEQAQTSVSLSDTVGFIRDLPHKLVEAFQATLSEAVDADLLIHVMDASSPVLQEQKDEVDRVLEDIGASGVPQILVCNKLDRLEPSARPRSLVDAVEDRAGRHVSRVFVSALEGTGLDELRGVIAACALRLQPTPADDAMNTNGHTLSYALSDS
jgi:GTP-binding protein HflX